MVDRKSTMPILANILLTADSKRGLTIAATDLGVGITGSYGAAVKRPGGVTIAARVFRYHQEPPRGLKSPSQSPRTTATVNKSGRVEYKIVGTSDADYPSCPTRKRRLSSLDARVFSDMIEKTLFSVSTDETRYHLNGVFLISKGDTLRMVSTDGHRLSV